MTQTLIEQLNGLQRFTRHGIEGENGAFILAEDLRAIIDEAPEVEPSLDLIEAVGIVLEGFSLPSAVRKILETAYYDKSVTIDSPPPSPDLIKLVGELVEALEDDAHAATFQSMAQYRKWLLDLVNGAGK